MSQPNQPVHVQEKTAKPQGLLPKNVQSWLLIGLAFLMVAIMWLTGGKKPPVPAKSASSVAPVQAPLEVNETKIAELQNRIEDLQRQQLVAQSALAQQTRVLGVAGPQDSQQPQQQSVSGNLPNQGAEDPIQAERKRRAYVSLRLLRILRTSGTKQPSLLCKSTLRDQLLALQLSYPILQVGNLRFVDFERCL